MKIKTILSLLFVFSFSYSHANYEWKKIVDSMFNILDKSNYVSYSYVMKTLGSVGDSVTLNGIFYINKKDSVYINENNQQLILVTPNYYAMKNNADKRIIIMDVKKLTGNNRKLYFQQFFNNAIFKEYEKICESEKYFKLANTVKNKIKLEYNITDSLSLNCNLVFVLNSENYKLNSLSYDVQRFINFKKQSSESDIKQKYYCFDYRFERNKKTEGHIEKVLKLISDSKNNKSFNIIRH